MNIFSQENFDHVQSMVGNGNGYSLHRAKDPAEDETTQLNRQSEYMQELLAEIDALPNGDVKNLVQECIQEMLSFYGHGIKRILDIISKGNNSAATEIYNNLIEDSFISGLLLIHDLHPLDLKTRLYQALEKVKPYMDSHGGSVEIVSLENGVAKLKLSGSCKGCPSSSSTLELGIKQAIEEHCPDLAGLEVEGAVDAPSKRASQNLDAGWRIIKGLDVLPNNAMKAVDVPGLQLIVSRVNHKLYAYRNFCPACERSFSNGILEENILSCQLGHKYDVHHAGICTDDGSLHLEPFPLLEENGVVKIAVG